MTQINHKNQTTYNGCIPACLAMLCNKPVSIVSDKYLDPIFLPTNTPESFGRKFGLKLELLPANFIQNVMGGQIYLASVPSITAKYKTHMIILDTRFGDIRIFDPSNFEQYTKETLSHFHLVYRVLEAPALEFKCQSM